MSVTVFGLAKKIIPIVLGASAGYAYYYYIGCVGGSCPITGNPWTSTAYGAVIGVLMVPWKKQQTTTNDHHPGNKSD